MPAVMSEIQKLTANVFARTEPQNDVLYRIRGPFLDDGRTISRTSAYSRVRPVNP